MRSRLVVGATAAFAVAALVATAAWASAGAPVDRATGGGQTIVGTQGAGNTIAFTARNVQPGGEVANGQVQYIDRSAGTGQAQQKYHGTVTCLVVEGTVAVLAGVWDRAEGAEEFFQILVQDNGEGNGEDDAIIVNEMAPDASCDEDNFDRSDDVELARGNAQVYDAP